MEDILYKNPLWDIRIREMVNSTTASSTEFPFDDLKKIIVHYTKIKYDDPGRGGGEVLEQPAEYIVEITEFPYENSTILDANHSVLLLYYELVYPKFSLIVRSKGFDCIKLDDTYYYIISTSDTLESSESSEVINHWWVCKIVESSEPTINGNLSKLTILYKQVYDLEYKPGK